MSAGNEPAYPAGTDLDGTWLDPATCKQWKPYTGLTKRELIAAMAMQGMLSGEYREATLLQAKVVAEHAVDQADALLAQLSKDPQP